MIIFNEKELNVLNTILNSINTKASTHYPFTAGYSAEQYIEENLSYVEIDNLHEKLNNELRRVHK